MSASAMVREGGEVMLGRGNWKRSNKGSRRPLRALPLKVL
jgi:hypothetical protein